jgi:hypothetical protein
VLTLSNTSNPPPQKTNPKVIVLRKRDFLDLDNPLLAWMLDYDAVSAVLKSLPAFKGLAQEAMEHVLDRCVRLLVTRV